MSDLISASSNREGILESLLGRERMAKESANGLTQ